ncbi:ABC transporter ATP-binding protein QhpF [Paracoccus denitrificans]|jgi:ATP-binding cassette subfamily B protein|uniref:ABC transporter related protein n=1 Tax=Paracoccus denitrificans (strain Pd 1222) TaxID=318586 RepID=A1B2R1_PARDP|nr:ABC transporter ATP-binding protein [Paracoccus denitrificans]ABL69805.1 ABC transporter related protein [Paracoccus denitrificans PD1222]MBB4629412.1 ATP-binding cassette subfamily B protein [Paracoccus denitrificans]MCU7430923.1 ABC transporter ATP-binding protein/permease [Paracoccus denitrificans]QAR25209.1 ABC transporter ATP-binding protein [Paracoccus denitrificans]UPV94087.1 ABC transporter ATP-binding protein/permease [Paracoccus denitrificans]
MDRLAARLARLIFGPEAAGWLAPVMARALPSGLVVLAASLAAAALGLAMPMLTRQVIDAGIMARDMGALIFWAGLSFALGLGAVGFGIVNGMLHLRASARMLADLRGRLFGAALARDPACPDLPLGEAMARLDGDCAEIQGFAFDTGLVAVGALFRLAGGLGLMIALDWRMAILPLLAAPFELWFLSRARPRTRALAEEVRNQRGALSTQMAETLSARATLRGLGALDQRAASFGAAQQAQIAGLTRQRLWSETVGAVSQTITAILRGIILLVGGWQVVRGEWQIGTLVAFLAYAGMMSGPLRNLLGLYHAQARARVAADRLGAVIASARPDEGAEPPPGPLSIALRDARAEGAAHHPVTATILPGQRVLLDGPSGIGKSRLMAVLTRDAPLAEGSARLAGAEVAHLRPLRLAARVIHLAQRPAILRGTLAENLRLAAPDAGDAALWQVLEAADLAGWARAGAGLATPIGETGANLSGGLRQRIAIARALQRPAEVLIFDEAFSEIDDAACQRILAAIEARHADATRIFIAHSGPAREGRFDQRITLTSSAPIFLISRGEMPYQREKAREKAV